MKHIKNKHLKKQPKIDNKPCLKNNNGWKFSIHKIQRNYKKINIPVIIVNIYYEENLK